MRYTEFQYLSGREAGLSLYLLCVSNPHWLMLSTMIRRAGYN